MDPRPLLAREVVVSGNEAMVWSRWAADGNASQDLEGQPL